MRILPRFAFFMSYFIYILYSETSDKYYVGHTGDLLDERIRKHNANHKGFTGRSNDWELVYKETSPDKIAGLKREMEIKSWKSRKRIQSLISSTE